MRRMRLQARRDDGIGLVEVMVAMLILTILMLAMLSLIITALNTVAENQTRASATELATQRLEQARSAALTGDCTNVKAIVEAVTDTTDGRGVPLQVVGTTNCVQTAPDPHDEPVLARVTVTVTTTQPGYSNPVATTSSDIYVRFQP
jgi:Tfp pilus assembly protein PilV